MTRVEAILGTGNKNVFFPAIRYKRNQEILEKKLSWNWEATGHKIYPSGIKSWTMCPLQFIQEDVHIAPDFPLDSYYKMEVGTALHKMFQEKADEIERLLWEKPDFSNIPCPDVLNSEMLSMKNFNMDKFMRDKYKQIYPEVPMFDGESGVSGRADLILNLKGEPVVFDLKTTSVLDAQKNKEGEWEVDRWAKACKAFPKLEHRIQVCIYAHLINKFKYYSKPVKRCGLGYLNLLMPAGYEPAEFETYFDFTDELESKTANLLQHIGKHRLSYINKIEEKCTYPLCRVHAQQ